MRCERPEKQEPAAERLLEITCEIYCFFQTRDQIQRSHIGVISRFISQAIPEINYEIAHGFL